MAHTGTLVYKLIGGPGWIWTAAQRRAKKRSMSMACYIRTLIMDDLAGRHNGQ